MNLQIPKEPWQVVKQLNGHGYEAYAVGGCVRDAMLGAEPKDWDICTNALPEQILACFKNERTIPTGIAHGTVTVMIENIPIEVTTYRVDGAYSDCRHPDGVTFTSSLAADLARRDFTMNAMAYHPTVGLVDLYGGREDLSAGMIRCVGDAADRFGEDSLRILRGLRFASVLGFSVEKTAAFAMRELSSLLVYVSVERIYTEITKLLIGKAAGRVLMQNWEILCHVLPFANPCKKSFDVIAQLPAEPIVRYAALYRGNEKAQLAMEKLRAPKTTAGGVALLAQAQCQPVPTQLSDVRKAVNRYGFVMTEHIFSLMEGFGEDIKIASEFLAKIRDQKLCCSFKELAVSGSDLKEIGFASGKELGDTLASLLNAVMENRVPNERKALLEFAVENFK